MKKTITFAILALLAVQVLAQEVKFTADKADWHSVSWSDKWNVLRFEIPIETPIPHAEVTGKAILIAVPDTVQYLKAYTFDVDGIEEDMLTRFSLKDGKLIISDPNFSLYILHYTGETVGLIANSRSRVCKETDIEAVNVIDSTFSIFVEASSKTGSSLLMKSMLRMMKMSGKDLQSISYGLKAGLDATNSVVPQPSSEVIEDNQTFRPSDYQISEDLNIFPSENLSKKEAYGNPCQLDFLWGFSNWGGSPFTGLMGMSDAGYSLRTSFSSSAANCKSLTTFVSPDADFSRKPRMAPSFLTRSSRRCFERLPVPSLEAVTAFATPSTFLIFAIAALSRTTPNAKST